MFGMKLPDDPWTKLRKKGLTGVDVYLRNGENFRFWTRRPEDLRKDIDDATAKDGWEKFVFALEEEFVFLDMDQVAAIVIRTEE